MTPSSVFPVMIANTQKAGPINKCMIICYYLWLIALYDPRRPWTKKKNGLYKEAQPNVCMYNRTTNNIINKSSSFCLFFFARQIIFYSVVNSESIVEKWTLLSVFKGLPYTQRRCSFTINYHQQHRSFSHHQKIKISSVTLGNKVHWQNTQTLHS